MELSWVRAVVIWMLESAAMSLSAFPARSAIASRLSARDNPKSSARSLAEGKRVSGSVTRIIAIGQPPEDIRTRTKAGI
jgi:hypothetical protein